MGLLPFFPQRVSFTHRCLHVTSNQSDFGNVLYSESMRRYGEQLEIGGKTTWTRFSLHRYCTCESGHVLWLPFKGFLEQLRPPGAPRPIERSTSASSFKNPWQPTIPGFADFCRRIGPLYARGSKGRCPEEMFPRSIISES